MGNGLPRRGRGMERIQVSEMKVILTQQHDVRVWYNATEFKVLESEKGTPLGFEFITPASGTVSIYPGAMATVLTDTADE
jgi:hypothetical protein